MQVKPTQVRDPMGHPVCTIIPRCRTATSSAEAVVLATSLLLLQVWRRLYECAFVSVHSDAATINLIHYASGFVHYFCACVGVILEAPWDGNSIA